MVPAMLANEADAMKDILRDQPIGRLGRPEEIASFGWRPLHFHNHPEKPFKYSLRKQAFRRNTNPLPNRRY